jgi:hypothetical protein
MTTQETLKTGLTKGPALTGTLSHNSQKKRGVQKLALNGPSSPLALSEQRFDQVQGQLDRVRVRQDDGVATGPGLPI